jgi:hypothetical protein
MFPSLKFSNLKNLNCIFCITEFCHLQTLLCLTCYFMVSQTMDSNPLSKMNLCLLTNYLSKSYCRMVLASKFIIIFLQNVAAACEIFRKFLYVVTGIYYGLLQG